MRFKAVLWSLAAFLLLAAPAWADTFTYRVNSHPDGNAAPPFYGLRLDFNGQVHTFAFTDVLFTIDPDAGTASMSGVITHNQGSSGDTTYDIAASFSMMTIRDLDSSGWFNGGDPIADLLAAGIDADNAIVFKLDSLTLSGGTSYGGPLSWFGKANASGDEFLLVVGHRLPGHGDPGGDPLRVVGFGWVQTKNGQTGTNDFLFVFDMEPVPEPGTLGLLGGGLAALGLFRRRRGRPR